MKTKLKCLGAQTYQNSYKDFISKEANNKGSDFLNYVDFYKDCKSMSILFQISNQPFPTPPNQTLSCRVLTAGRNVILHFWLAWLTLSFFSFNLCPSSSYLIRSKCVKSLIICFKNKIHTCLLLTYCICNRFSMFALCHSIQTGISITFTVFVAMLRKKF